MSWSLSDINWEWLPAHIIPGSSVVAAAYDAYGNFVEVYTPKQIEQAIQSGSLPAAPRSRAEMTSGMWTPADAMEIGQLETLRRLADRNAAARANATGATLNPVIPPTDPDDWTMYYILGAIAATGLLVAIVRK